MFAGIFRTAVGAARERCAGIGDARDIGIADQRKDGMIKRCGAELDLATLGRVVIRREHQAEEIKLLFSQGGFVLLREVLPFRGQTADDLIRFEPGLIHPGKLREELQVAPVARSERHQRLRATRRARPFE